MAKILCIYHNQCADGFGAAWAVWKAFKSGEIDFHAADYKDPPPDVEGRDVLMVDFSYKRPVLEEMAKSARSILILDHHKSAAEDLAGYPEPPEFIEWDEEREWDSNVAALFDMNRSGAGLAWDYFHDATRPPLIDLIENRDLWRHEQEGYPEHQRLTVRAMHAYLMSIPREFEDWDKAIDGYEDPGLADRMLDEGGAILRNNTVMIDEILTAGRREARVDGWTVPVCNVPYQLASEAGHILAKGQAFSLTYFDSADTRHFSLRSDPDGQDVGEIAVRLGGGGHKHAAGFEAPLADPGHI